MTVEDGLCDFHHNPEPCPICHKEIKQRLLETKYWYYTVQWQDLKGTYMNIGSLQTEGIIDHKFPVVDTMLSEKEARNLDKMPIILFFEQISLEQYTRFGEECV